MRKHIIQQGESFLPYMIKKNLRFRVKWINWIKKCLQSSTISIIVNGRLTKEFGR